MMEEKVRKLIAKAPDLAQPIEEFAYKYQQWLIELEAALAESEAWQLTGCKWCEAGKRQLGAGGKHYYHRLDENNTRLCLGSKIPS